MKRLTYAFISLLYIIVSLTSQAVPAMASSSKSTGSDKWPDGPDVFAGSAIVMEASTGLILYEKNMDVSRYPASITKIMSALLAIENSSLSDVVTFSKDAVFNVDLDSSRIGIDVGEKLTMQQCLYGMLLESANEVTYAVAEHVGGTIPKFAEMMNARAKQIGCKNTHFVNPHGLFNSDHYTTAHDMALITREAMKNATFRKIFTSRTYQIPPTNIQKETRPLRNHHKFVLRQDNRFRYDDCIGGKTGFTNKARYTLVSVAKRGDLELICVVMKDDSGEYQYTDTSKLFDYAFDHFSIYKIADLESTKEIKESPMFNRYNPLLSPEATPISLDKNGYLVLPNTASFKDAQKKVSFKPVSKLKKGINKIGTISYTYDGKYVGGANILYNNSAKLKLIESEIDAKNPAGTNTKDGKPGLRLRPVVIGIIAGLILLILGIYCFVKEHSRRKRRKAYYRRRAKGKRFKNDDYLDL